ncbi:hypothetical protein CDAR_245591 [Caerostris darwini]|uniref:Uncharacterized protein n=1 Tax=Caerostris darwini TaxID=1538125 RepID=A0AAV4P3H2_9ARAC|nr:hypothetical protein CDAR_245271 [Caerostris darwini]GIX89829.1 hypothetical protein CDAR_245591 [Caerostris darwini]
MLESIQRWTAARFILNAFTWLSKFIRRVTPHNCKRGIVIYLRGVTQDLVAINFTFIFPSGVHYLDCGSLCLFRGLIEVMESRCFRIFSHNTELIGGIVTFYKRLYKVLLFISFFWVGGE